MRNIVVLIALIGIFHTLSFNDVASQDNTNVYKANVIRTKIKRGKSPIVYYANSVSTFNIILSGDIQENPGPGSSKCTECNKGVGTNRKRLQCIKCFCFTHASCSNLPIFEQNRMTSRIVVKWTCSGCILSELPYFGVRNIAFNTDTTDDPITTENSHLKLLNKHRNQTSIAHLNTQSLLSTFTEFSLMLNIYDFDIITLSETWLQDNKEQLDYVNIPGYKTLFKNRKSRGGGVGIYAKDSLHFKSRDDLTKHSSMEVLCVEFRGRNKNTPYLLITVYQPSSKEEQKIEWLNNFETLIAEISIKWSGQEKESTKRYKDILNSYNLYQHVNKPTRKGATLIDHIITNIPGKVTNSDVLITDEISDHDTPYILLSIKKERFEPRYKFVHDEKNLDMNSYIDDFSKLPFSLIFTFDDPDEQIDTLNHLILSCIERHAPLKRVKLTRPIAPWMKDPAIQDSRNQLEFYRKKAQEDPNYKNDYKEKRTNYRKTLKEIKNSFFKKSLSSKDQKSVWNTIHRILSNQKTRIKHDPSEMNEYFSNLAANLTGKSNVESTLPDDIKTTENEQSFKIQHTTYNEINKILKNLKNDCSSGHDNIPIRFIKPVSEFITSPLVHIINNCINKEIFPQQWKIARVCPIPKIDTPISTKDYRPISVLPVLSKIYERVILSQLCEFIESNQLYNETQSGFRKGHTTTTLMLKLRDDIKKAMAKSEVTLSILIDYSKAFDTIDHKNLLLKLRDMNFLFRALKILSSYLKDRKQYVQIEDKISSLKSMFYGVPQGSILGPVLFNLYVIELSNQINSASIQYADDTTLYKHCKVRDLFQSIKDMEKDVDNLLAWSKENNLLFNSDKLKLIIFHSKRLRAFDSDRSYLCRCAGMSIEQEENVKLLGIQFDQNLSWTCHINNVIKSSHSTLRALRKFSRFTPFHVRKTLAETLILSRISYGNVVFSQIPDYLICRLQKIQNMAAGYVLRRYANLQEVTNLKWLPVKEHIEFSISKLVHKSRIDNNHPSYLNVEFVVPTRNLRSSTKEPLVKNVGNGTFQNQARLGANIQSTCSQSTLTHFQLVFTFAFSPFATSQRIPLWFRRYLDARKDRIRALETRVKANYKKTRNSDIYALKHVLLLHVRAIEQDFQRRCTEELLL
ncbi:uncharacterized protein LOC130629967 [Hydractinia symbiolongicarpus]|uniref:uncharacterized protein LOC130629967 n=1 Tax=Hydractinia symbiolongicarpus TaxID=13093 RepID=UPI00254BEDF3|nr:uncharacterized protein LOC130629967 [Hydractinia symbiolongicarpus]